MSLIIQITINFGNRLIGQRLRSYFGGGGLGFSTPVVLYTPLLIIERS